MSMMLASVSDVFEARLVLDAEVDWVDLKNPRDGALGALDLEHVRMVVDLVDSSRPVSATIGSRWDLSKFTSSRLTRLAEAGVDYVKVGINARHVSDSLIVSLQTINGYKCGVIAVCIAEEPPRISDIARLAESGIAGIMLDTNEKAGRSLTELLDISELEAFVRAGREFGLLTGLAGRLRVEDVPIVKLAGPDYIGFRSALCPRGQRRSRCVPEAIARVREAMRTDTSTSKPHKDSEVA